MNELGRIDPTPEQEDPELHRVLFSLPSFAPHNGFADRVMARVSPPDAAPVTDEALDKRLADLPAFAPQDGFTDRVMARVYRPEPAWLQRLRAAARAVLAPKRRWAVAGGLAAASATSLVGMVVIVSSYWSETQALWSAVAGGALNAWHTTVQFGMEVGSGIGNTMGSWNVTAATVAAAAVGGVAIWSLCAVGLVRTVRAYIRERVVVHAHG